MSSTIDLIDATLSKIDEVVLVRPFRAEEGYFQGSIKIMASPKVNLLLEVIIPQTYPYLNGRKSSIFRCLNATGYAHINADDSICLDVPFINDFASRLRLEIEHLKEWRDRYYLKDNTTDEPYEYPILPHQQETTFLFTDTDARYKEGNFGEFQYVEFTNTDSSNPVTLVTQIGNHPCIWAKDLIVNLKRHKGFYYFLDREPLQRGIIAKTNWQQFNGYFSQQFLYKLAHSRNHKGVLYVLLGYYLPNTNEVHWLAIQLDSHRLPIRSIAKTRNYIQYECLEQSLIWCKTQSINPSRFFGRGSISEKLASKKLLIIGAGAIGSCLAKILTRTGSRFIRIIDYETIEPGNICRSEYFLLQTGQHKVPALVHQLRMISPFVDANYADYISKNSQHSVKKLNQNQLIQYDYIFDCTSDNELCTYLDELKLDIPIINLSITNEAKQLVCVIGKREITKELSVIYQKLASQHTQLIYEGIGCWHPTFAASYFDINALLNVAVKNLHHRLEANLPLNTFVVQAAEKDGYQTIEVIGY